MDGRASAVKKRTVPVGSLSLGCDYALDNFQSRTMYQADYARATIAVRHVYANNTPLGMIRDHDNIETKAMIDTIKSHFLPDDNGMFLNLFFTAGFGQRNGTEIVLLPYDNYLGFDSNFTAKNNYENDRYFLCRKRRRYFGLKQIFFTAFSQKPSKISGHRIQPHARKGGNHGLKKTEQPRMRF